MALPLSYLHFNEEIRLVICTECGSAFGHDRLRNHLKNDHKVSNVTHPGLSAYLAAFDILPFTHDVQHPVDGHPGIPGLAIKSMLQCPDCRFFTVNRRRFNAHSNSKHGSSLTPLCVRTQTISSFSQSLNYFVLSNGDPVPTVPVRANEAQLQVLYDQLHHARPQPDLTIGPSDHPDGNTRWFAITGFRDYLEGRDMAVLSPKTEGPQDQEKALRLICGSVERNVRRVMEMLNWRLSSTFRLTNRDARRLNTFQPGTCSLDPIQYLQEGSSRTAYALIAKKLVSFFARTFKDESLFVPTPIQSSAWADVQAKYMAAPDVLDVYVRHFTAALVVQDTAGDPFASALYCFAAVVFWHPRHHLNPNMNAYSSFLAKLTYVGQLWLLDHCFHQNRIGFPAALARLCEQNVHNDQDAPLSHILSIRPLASKIALDQQVQMQIYWSADQQSLTYSDVTLSLSHLRFLVLNQCRQAQILFERDLVLGMHVEPIPLHRLVDNWQNNTVCYSFLSDPHNESLVVRASERLIAHVNCYHGTMFWKPSGPGAIAFIADAARQYEEYVQQFLDKIAFCLYIGSGQPARITEFMTLRWHNGSDGVRNIRIHNGEVKYMIAYHKSRNKTGKDYHPVRVPLPQIQQLLVRFLVFVQPFRQMLAANRPEPKQTCPQGRLFTRNGNLWSPNRFTSILRNASEAVIGVSLVPSVWRQMAKAIAVKKLGWVANLVDATSAVTEEEPDEFLPDVFHLQSAHTVNTGTRLYGQSIGFNSALTDTEMSQYTSASHVWHAFLFPPKTSSNKPDQAAQLSAPLPLAKRLCIAPSLRRFWTEEEAKSAMQSVYGAGAEYRSIEQAKLCNAIALGHTPIVAVLGTGAGKSLAYLAYQRLPRSGICVVILPLVALKQDTAKRCQKHGVMYTEWNASATPAVTAPLVLVSVDEAVGSLFRAFLAGLVSRNELGCIVFDECHLPLVSDHYRPVMDDVAQFSLIDCQRIYLTGTLPPVFQPELYEKLGLTHPCHIRARTFRVDIAYRVITLHDPWHEAVLRHVRTLLDSIAADAQARLIVYCTNIPEGQKIAASLGLSFYHSKAVEKHALYDSWIQGAKQGIVATTALSEGIDYPHVRHTVHVGAPYGAIDLAQSSGRGGRDGQGSTAHILLAPGWLSAFDARPIPNRVANADRHALRDMLGQTHCRALVLASFLDQQEATCAQCDLCQNGEQRSTYGKYRDGQDLVLHANETAAERDALRFRLVNQPALDRAKLQDHLDFFSRCCLLCLATNEGTGVEHTFDQCQNPCRATYVASHATWGRWLDEFAACFHCGLPQSFCDRCVPDSSSTTCTYRDILFPLLWASWHNDHWRKLRTSTAGIEFNCERDFRAWAGKRKKVYGLDATNMLLLSSRVLQHISDCVSSASLTRT